MEIVGTSIPRKFANTVTPCGSGRLSSTFEDSIRLPERESADRSTPSCTLSAIVTRDNVPSIQLHGGLYQVALVSILLHENKSCYRSEHSAVMIYVPVFCK